MLNWSLLSEYNDKGLLQLPNGFTSHDLKAIKAELPRVLAERTERTVMEADGKSVRSVYGVHQHNKFLSRLARHPQLLMMAQQILQDNVYVYQSKLNLKLPFAGDVWDWHQDYTYWCNEDGMPAPQAVSVAIYLDDVNEFNGPLYFLPGSHRSGVQRHRPPEGKPAGYEDAPGWISNLTAKLKYSIDHDCLRELTLKHGIVDELIAEPPGGAHRDTAGSAQLLGQALRRHLAELSHLGKSELIAQRYARFRNIGPITG